MILLLADHPNGPVERFVNQLLGWVWLHGLHSAMVARCRRRGCSHRPKKVSSDQTSKLTSCLIVLESCLIPVSVLAR